jgi:hypothetical protein
MNANIALATVSGKAYFTLLEILKKKGLPFLSLKPWDVIPLNVKVVVTTKEERQYVTHPNVVVFEVGSNPTEAIDRAILQLQGKRRYDKVVVGVYPGKSCGVTIFGDNAVIETYTCSSLHETVQRIGDCLHRVPARIRIVKVGDGAPLYSEALLSSLDAVLPSEIGFETVRESGTNRVKNETAPRGWRKDVLSAKEIAGRPGQRYPRKNAGETRL